MVLKVAIELNLFKIIAKASPSAHISVETLPSSRPSTPSMLDHVLYFLASHSMLSYSLRTLEEGRIEKLYAFTLASQLFVNNNDELIR
ncbi:hypothetical protein Pint_20456 [Pistacia integerrima]|uniref:Uncharacterized protein n=1 Tax=Pistacia integerrima TaxID=434235 RepID=A0ACC0XAH2_9ROSI|nr:hypothetical protein Pint_20456 [Pistacia integerrima]